MEHVRVVLLARGRSACRRRAAASRLGHAQIAGSARLGYFVNDQFESRVATAGVEENRLVDGAVLLLEALVIGQDIDGELILLGIGALQLNLDGADLLRSSLARHSEFIICP